VLRRQGGVALLHRLEGCGWCREGKREKRREGRVERVLSEQRAEDPED